MSSKITPVPPLPKEILNAVNNENLAVFMGAGVSRLVGCLGWDELAKNMVNRCFIEKSSDGPSLINYKEKDTLIQNSEHKKTITICHHILKEAGLEVVFFDEMWKALKEGKSIIPNIYDELYKLRGLFITTNADTHIDRLFSPTNVLYKETDFVPNRIDRMYLYHIHGSIKDPSSIVFTVSQYFKRYNNPQFREFLKRILDEYVVLFIGYGMAEFELLDFLFEKFDSAKGKELKHFILLPFYRGEENILNFEQSYYNTLGITVLPYEKDEKGYGQLYEVIKFWNKEINQVSVYLYNSYSEIDDAITNFTENKLTQIFQLIKNDKPQEDYFFKQLTLTSNPSPWLKPLKEKGYFNPQNNPVPQEVPDQSGYYTMPYWNVLGFLENVADKNMKEPSEEITNTLLEVVNSITNYRDESGERIDNYYTDWIILKIIFTFPAERIEKQHMGFIRNALKSKWDNTLIASEIGKTVIPKLINAGAKSLLLELLDVILDYKRVKDVFGTYESILDEHWLSEALKKHKLEIAKLCGIETAEIALKKIKAIIQEDKSQFDNVWIPTIEDHPQNSSLHDRYECQLVHFVRDMFELSDANQIRGQIEELLKEEHPIFKRIAIYTINRHYNDLNDLFWNWTGNPLNERGLKHEIYELLKSNCSSFNDKQIEQILEWIESKEYYIPDEFKDDEEQKEKIKAYSKREWLSALLKTKKPKIIKKYEEYTKINQAKIEHPGFDFWMGETRIGSISPIELEDLLIKSNAEIAEYLNSFKEEDRWGEPSKEGLSDALRKCVSDNPGKFSSNLEPFLNVHRMYQHSLLWGLWEAWRAKETFEWDEILKFTLKIVESDSFWKEEEVTGQYNYRNQVISVIAKLIEEGTKDDNHAFSPELLPEAEEILLILADKTYSDLSEMDDLVTSVLNTSKGKIFSAMVNYSLRYARLYRKEQEDRWVESIKADFEKRINREFESSLEISVILGEYLPNLYYLDKKWVINSINQIFPMGNDIHWNAAFTGYLFYSSSIYKESYFLLRKNEHYAKAVKTDFQDDHIAERLVQHICIGYIEGWEKLDDKNSLICKLIENRNATQLSAIVHFFWMLRDKLTDKIRAKIKPLWRELFEIVSQNEENPEYQEILSKLSKWSSLIEDIDDEYVKWLKVSAQYVKGFNTSLFVEYLLKYAPRAPENVAEIYLEMLSSNEYPKYKKEDIGGIVQTLYEKGQKGLADRICNMYGAKGYDFLRELYEKHKGDKYE